MALRRRSQGRALAMQALCVFDALGDSFLEQLSAFVNDSQVHADLGLEKAPPPETLSFARVLAEGAWQNRQRYDELINRAASGWTVSRMSPVDRNLLRLGLHELLEHPENPPEVIINEAVELARLFSGADAPGFVNAILDANRRHLGIPAGPRPERRGQP